MRAQILKIPDATSSRNRRSFSAAPKRLGETANNPITLESYTAAAGNPIENALSQVPSSTIMVVQMQNDSAENGRTRPFDLTRDLMSSRHDVCV